MLGNCLQIVCTSLEYHAVHRLKISISAIRDGGNLNTDEGYEDHPRWDNGGH